MAEKPKTLTCTFFVGGMPVEKMSPDQRKIIAQRMGDAMSDYYTAHPEEYQKIKGAKNEKHQD